MVLDVLFKLVEVIVVLIVAYCFIMFLIVYLSPFALILIGLAQIFVSDSSTHAASSEEPYREYADFRPPSLSKPAVPTQTTPVPDVTDTPLPDIEEPSISSRVQECSYTDCLKSHAESLAACRDYACSEYIRDSCENDFDMRLRARHPERYQKKNW